MQHSLLTWLSSSVSGGLLLSVVLVLRLISFSPPHFHKRASLTPHSPLQVRRFIGEAPARASEGVQQNDQQQNKQAFPTLVFLRPEHRRDDTFHLLRLPLSYPDHQDSFCPRKLPSSTATDDPFPS